MINDPKERERWTSKRCCNNCQHLRSKSPTWPFSTHWCIARKKHLICDLNYDHGCKKFVSHFTPEENKQLWCLAAAEIEALDLVKDIIDKMKQDEPTPPGIQDESQKKGWLDYGLMMSEIGLHRYNAIHRIKEHKEQFNPLAIPDLYHVAEYYESVGMEKVCCCLQAYGKDFMFTQDEVKEIIEKKD